MSPRRVALATTGGVDPTKTITIRKQYAQDIQRRLLQVERLVVAALVDRDVLGRTNKLFVMQAELPPPRAWAGLTPAVQIERFRTWLAANWLEVFEFEFDRAGNIIGGPAFVDTAITAAYTRAIAQADAKFKRAVGVEPRGVFPPGTPSVVRKIIRDARIRSTFQVVPEAVLRQARHQGAIDFLLNANYREIHGVGPVYESRIVRQLTLGVQRNTPIGEIVRNIRDQTRLQMNQANALARTEIVRAHAEATLNRFEDLGVAQVGADVEMEFTTAGDQKVCVQCQELEGVLFPIDDARGVIPVHIGCRCSWIPVGVVGVGNTVVGIGNAFGIGNMAA